MKDIEADKKQIIYEKKKLYESLLNVSIYVEDKDKYTHYVEKGRNILFQERFKEAKTNKEKAEIKMFEATVNAYYTLAKT